MTTAPDTPDPGTPVPENATAFGRAWVEGLQQFFGSDLSPETARDILPRHPTPAHLNILGSYMYQRIDPDFLQKVLTRMHEIENEEKS